MKRVTINLTDEEYSRLRELAKKYNKSMTKLMRIYMRLGMTKERPYTDLIIRKRGRDHVISIAK